MVVMVTQCS